MHWGRAPSVVSMSDYVSSRQIETILIVCVGELLQRILDWRMCAVFTVRAITAGLHLLDVEHSIGARDSWPAVFATRAYVVDERCLFLSLVFIVSPVLCWRYNSLRRSLLCTLGIGAMLVALNAIRILSCIGLCEVGVSYELAHDLLAFWFYWATIGLALVARLCWDHRLRAA
jgi:hypothetical protein